MMITHYVHNLSPIAFQIGFFVMPWYWLVYFLGYFWVFFSLNYFKKINLSQLSHKCIYQFMTRGFFFMLLGGRLTYIFLYNFSYYLTSPLKVFYVWEGGMSFHGGLIGFILFTYFYSKKLNISLYSFTDPVAVTIPLVLGFGRIANFINGELAGRITQSRFGIIFEKFYDQNPRHPSQLYQALSEGFLLFFILWISKKNLLTKGRQSSLFLIFYGFFRFIVEYFRMPDKQLGFIFLKLSMGQILCIFMIMIGLFLLKKNQGQKE